jgi:hypothetical protein
MSDVDVERFLGNSFHGSGYGDRVNGGAYTLYYYGTPLKPYSRMLTLQFNILPTGANDLTNWFWSDYK